MSILSTKYHRDNTGTARSCVLPRPKSSSLTTPPLELLVDIAQLYDRLKQHRLHKQLFLRTTTVPRLEEQLNTSNTRTCDAYSATR